MLKKWMTAGAAMLLAVTGLVAAIHLRNQDDIACMVILLEEQEVSVSFPDLDQVSFSGTLIDGKGDSLFHEYTGVLLRELLKRKGTGIDSLSTVTVTSADQYSVTFTGEELLQTDNVYAAITADGAAIEGIEPGSKGVQIIVFGDPNSRRCVRFANKITIE